MGTPYKSYRASRRKRELSVSETERESTTTDRRQILRVGNDRICLHRPAGILLPPVEGCETYQAWHSSTPQRVDSTEGRDASTIYKVPNTDVNDAVHVRTGSPEPRGSASVFVMSSLSIGRIVLFNDNVTVFTPTDWPADVYRDARKGYWMQMAADRFRFKRRIRETEVELGNVFSNEHRERYCCFL